MNLYQPPADELESQWRALIEAGAAGVHFEDQLASEKKCGHLGGKVLVPTGQFLRPLNAARLAADVMDGPTLLVARTDADSARLLTSDADERDRPFLTGERTPEGFFRIAGGPEQAIQQCPPGSRASVETARGSSQPLPPAPPAVLCLQGRDSSSGHGNRSGAVGSSPGCSGCFQGSSGSM
jgi:hypothetical protein